MNPRVELFAPLILILLITSSSAFTPQHVGTLEEQRQAQRCSRGLHMTVGSHNVSPFCRQQSILYSTPSEDEDEASSETMSTTKNEPAAASKAPQEPEGTQYPINVPSPLLLGSGMVLAIVCTGMFLYTLIHKMFLLKRLNVLMIALYCFRRLNVSVDKWESPSTRYSCDVWNCICWYSGMFLFAVCCHFKGYC
jgi:hypothetical protein